MSKQKDDQYDPYSKFDNQNINSTLKVPEQQSKWERKMIRIKSKLGEFKVNFLNGAFMGFLVGGSFGFVLGVYQAFVSRSIWVIPLSVLMSGTSFGFILGIGGIVRSDVQEEQMYQQMMKQTVHKGIIHYHAEPFWTYKMIMQEQQNTQ